MNLFEVFAKLTIDTGEYEKNVKTAKEKITSFASTAANVAKKVSTPWTALAKGVGTVSKGVVAGIGAIGAAAGAGIAALNGIAESTEEYRIAQGKLNTAFDAAGFSAETAQKSYSGFYGILGDTDTATEASQLLAKLAQSEEDVSKWTNVAAGVYGTFGDSLPVEGLIEAANETAKVGTVTGTLADALNWAGISEEKFNEQLAAAGSEYERNQLIMETLSGVYDGAAESFYKNNEQLVKSRENQERLNQTLAGIGTAVESAKAAFLSGFMPSIEQAGGKVTEFINRITTAFSEGGLSGAVEAGSGIIAEIVTEISGKLPEVVEMAKTIISTLVDGLMQNLPEITKGAAEALTAFLTGAMDMFPDIFNLGLELIIQLVEGLADNIDEIVDSAVSMIEKLVEILTNPDAVSRLLEAALEIMIAISEGLIKAIPQIITAVPEIIVNLVNAFWENRDKILDIGVNIVKGVWEGIKSMATWLGGVVSGFFSGIVNSAKKALGIHSPSKLFRDQIGKNIGLGVAMGIEDSEDEAVQAAAELAESVYDKSVEWIEKQTKYQEFSLAEQLEVWEAAQSQFVKESRQYADAEEKIFDLRKQIQDEYLGKVKEVTDKVAELQENYQTALADRANEIYEIYGLFDEVGEKNDVTGRELIGNLEDQINSIREFYSNLDVLAQRGAPTEMIGELRQMGPSASGELEALLELSDKQLTEYANLYKEKQQLANELAVNELKNLKEQTNLQIQENLQAAKTLYEQYTPTVGKSFTNTLADSIKNGASKVADAAADVVIRAMESAQAAMDSFTVENGYSMDSETGNNSNSRSGSSGGTVVNQYIQAVPMTPNELARQSVDAFDRLRWT